MATSRRKTWWGVVGYAVWGFLNVTLIVLEFFRDDPRWWRFLLSGIFLVVSVAGVLDRWKTLRSPEPVTGTPPPAA
jgi:CDP-diglyceride synthetase